LAWWYTSIIPALRRLRQEDCKFKAYLYYTAIQGLKVSVGWGWGSVVSQVFSMHKALGSTTKPKRNKTKVSKLVWSVAPVEHLPSMGEALGSTPSTGKRKRN
jgi:hypothetical protein